MAMRVFADLAPRAPAYSQKPVLELPCQLQVLQMKLSYSHSSIFEIGPCC